jgi:carbonic anhydrase
VTADGHAVDAVLARADVPPTELPPPPALAIAVVTCMDARIDPLAVLGLAAGDAHVIRNAGGVVTDDVIRSLGLSQTGLGTREVLVAQHTGCGAHPPDADMEASVREAVRLLRDAEALPHRDRVRGAVIDLVDGGVRAVADESPTSGGRVAEKKFPR